MSKVVKAWKESQGIKSLRWVTQNPDMNPIEHVWEHLHRKLRERATKIMSVAILKETLLKEWQNMDQTIVDNLIKSMKNRIHTLERVNGGPILY